MSGKTEVFIIIILLYLCQQTVQHDEIEDNLLSIKNNLKKLKKNSIDDLQRYTKTFASIFEELSSLQCLINECSCKNCDPSLTMAEMFYYQRGPIEIKGFEYYVRLERLKNDKSKENLINLLSEISNFEREYHNHAPELFETLDIFGESLVKDNISEQIKTFLSNTNELEALNIVDSLRSSKLQAICLDIMKNQTTLKNTTNLFEAFSISGNLKHSDLQNLAFSRLVNSLNKTENDDLVQEFLEKFEVLPQNGAKMAVDLFEIWKEILKKLPLNEAIQKIRYFRIMKFQTKSLQYLLNVSKGKNILHVVDYILELQNVGNAENGRLTLDLVKNIPYSDEYLEKVMTDSNATYDEFSSQKLQTMSLKCELKRLRNSNDPRLVEIAWTSGRRNYRLTA